MDDRAGLFRPGWIAKLSVYGLEGRTARGEARGQATVLLARRATTIQRWSLDARSEGQFACPLWRRRRVRGASFCEQEGQATVHDMREAIMEGAVQRVRPKMMTVAAIMGGFH